MLERTQQVALSDLTPLEFMLGVLRDASREDAERMQAAIQAAPYVHPRLASSQVTVDDKRTAEQFTDAELEAIARASSARASETEESEAGPNPIH
jgi:hypothetical protein